MLRHVERVKMVQCTGGVKWLQHSTVFLFPVLQVMFVYKQRLNALTTLYIILITIGWPSGNRNISSSQNFHANASGDQWVLDYYLPNVLHVQELLGLYV